MTEWEVFDAGATSCGNDYEWNGVRWLSAFHVYIGDWPVSEFKYNWAGMKFLVINWKFRYRESVIIHTRNTKRRI